MMAASIVAGIFNANGGVDGKPVGFTDFHPAHANDDKFEIALMEQENASFDQLVAGIV